MAIVAKRPKFTYKPKLPPRYWHKRENRRAYFNWTIKHLLSPSLYSMESLYNLSYEQVIASGGRGAIQLFADSVALAIMDAYPEHHWQPWNFQKSPTGWWQELSERFFNGDIHAETTVREYMDDLALTYGVSGLDSWYVLAQRGLKRTDVAHLQILGGLEYIMPRLHPHHPWQLAKFSSPKRAQQKDLAKNLNQIFGDDLNASVSQPALDKR